MSDRQRYRRISKTLHERCQGALREHATKLTQQEIQALTTVALGWSDGASVTKEDYDLARAILDRIG